MKNKLLPFLVLLALACNDSKKQPEPEQQRMGFAALLPALDSMKVLSSGDTLLYYSDTKTGTGTTTYTYTYSVPRVELRKKGTVTPTPVPDPDPVPDPGTVVSFKGDIIPATEYVNRPGAGAEQWHNGTAAVGNLPQPLDVYYRIGWREVETDAQGVYTWTKLDNLIKTAINRGQKLSFGIMEHRGETDGDGRTSYDNGVSYYPLYLHKLMQAETANSRDWISNGIWVPNFNSQNYISRLGALNKAISDHLLSTKYTATTGPNAGKSVLLGDAIYCIDIRGFGTWGEWHTSSGMANWSAFPTGRQPTATALKAIIDAHTKTLNNWPLVIMVAAYDAGSSQFPVFHPYPDVAYYALTARNAWGAVGFRKDQWGATDEYLKKIAELNSKSYNGVPLKSLIMNKWREAPVTGEPMPGTAANLSDLVRQIKLYGATSFGNGNYGATPNSTQAKYVEQAALAAGYRLQFKDGSIGGGKITVTWENVGITPTYENWNTMYELKSGSTVVWTGNSSFKAKLFLPGTVTVTDQFPSIPAGNYTLTVKLVDPAGYRQPLVLSNRGRQTDGSYILK